ncbi:MAG TPA: ABC transporter substrate-binding protein [Gammaproteobacteria bacterium]
MVERRNDHCLCDHSRRRALKAVAALMVMGGAGRSPAATDSVRISIPGPLLMPFFPVELISRLGIDRQLDTQLAIRYHPTGVLALEDMLAGNAEFAGVGFPVLPKFLEQGRSVVAVARLSSGAPPYAIIVRADLVDEIRSIGDLRGRTLGVPVGSVTTKTYLQMVAELWVSSYGVRPQQLRWAPITQTFDGVYGAMAGQTVDAVFCEEPYSASLVRQGLGVTLASLSDPRNPVSVVGRDHLRAVIVTTPDFVGKRPERVQQMMRMLRRALQWTATATPQALVDRLEIADPAQRADIIDALTRLPPPYSGDGRFSETEIAATRDFIRAVGIELPHQRDVKTLIDDRWVNRD